MQYIISKENGISDFYFCKQTKNASTVANIHSHIEFIFALEGELALTVDKKTQLLHEGEAAIILPYQVHSYSTVKSSDIFFIACPPDYINEHKQMLTSKEFNPHVTAFGSCCRGIINDIIASDMNDDLKKKALLYYTLSEFIKNCEIIEKPPYEFDIYRKAIAYITEHYTESLTLERVSNYVGVSASHLSRVLNNGCNSSFSDILNALRIHHAKNLLIETDISISEAAYESGYGSLRNFNRIFKKFYGITPKEMRQQ